MLTEPNSKFVHSSFSPLTIKIKKEKEMVSKPNISSLNIKSVKPLEKKKDLVDSLSETSVKVETEGIFLVAASFKTQEKAEEGLSEFVSKGFDSVEILPKKEGEQYFRVSVGKVATMEEGYQVAASMKKNKKVDIWVYQTNHSL